MDNLIEVPIVFTMDNNYAPMGGVAIKSVILRSDPDKHYHIYVLHRGIKKATIEKLENMSEKHIKVESINLDEKKMARIQGFRHSFFPQESTDRLLIAELFEQYEKVVYLDCDVIVKVDIATFFQADLEGHLLGAIRTCAIPSTIKHNLEAVGFTDTFKSGVLLINTKLMRQKHVREHCYKLLEEDMKKEIPKYTWPDQDVLNIVCKGSVRYFGEEWNFITSPLNSYASPEGTLPPEQLKEHLDIAPICKIIHYTGDMRPWLYPDVPMGKEFWIIARQTDFYDELIIKLETAMKRRRGEFPLYNIKEGSDIILYGAGKKGDYLWKMIMKEYNFCHVILWVDKNSTALAGRNKRVAGIEEIDTAKYEQIVVAVESEELANTIKEDLIVYRGCSADKVVWAFQKR